MYGCESILPYRRVGRFYSFGSEFWRRALSREMYKVGRLISARRRVFFFCADKLTFRSLFSRPLLPGKRGDRINKRPAKFQRNGRFFFFLQDFILPFHLFLGALRNCQLLANIICCLSYFVSFTRVFIELSKWLMNKSYNECRKLHFDCWRL